MLSNVTDEHFELVNQDDTADEGISLQIDTSDILLDQTEAGERNILAISARGTKYTEVILSLETPLSEEAWKRLGEECHKIEGEIAFSCIINTDLTAGQLAQVLSAPKSLLKSVSRMAFSKTKISLTIKVDFAPLIEMLATNDELTHFSMRGFNDLESETLQQLAIAITHKQKLRSLTLSNCNIETDEVRYLAEMLRINNSLYSIDFSNNYINSDDVKCIADALTNNYNLYRISLANCWLNEKAWNSISYLFHTNPHILEIDLRGVGYTPFQTFINTFFRLNWNHTVLSIQLNGLISLFYQPTLDIATAHNHELQERNINRVQQGNGNSLDIMSLATTFIIRQWQDFKHNSKVDAGPNYNTRLGPMVKECLFDKFYQHWDSTISKVLHPTTHILLPNPAIRRISRFIIGDDPITKVFQDHRKDLANTEHIMCNLANGKAPIPAVFYFSNFYKKDLNIEVARQVVTEQVTHPLFMSVKPINIELLAGSLLRVSRYLRNCIHKKEVDVGNIENIFSRYRAIQVVSGESQCNIL
jgi:hypothetical protein